MKDIKLVGTYIIILKAINIIDIFLAFELSFTGFSVKIKIFYFWKSVKCLNFYWKTSKRKHKSQKNIYNNVGIESLLFWWITH